jgi:hypothetical protein
MVVQLMLLSLPQKRPIPSVSSLSTSNRDAPTPTNHHVPNTAFTFAEGASDLIIPQETVATSTLGVAITAAASVSCGLKDGKADCAIAANVNGQDSTLTATLPASSYVFQAIGQTSLISPTGGALSVRPAIAVSGLVALIGFIFALC